MADDFDSQREKFLAGLRSEESGGRYTFLDSTWGGYGGYRSAYLAPPEIQDERARQLVGDYYRRFGSWTSVAQAWLGGPGSVGKNVKDNYTGITSNKYAANVLRLAGLDGSAPPAPPVNPPTGVTPPPAAGSQTAPAGGVDYHDLGTQLESLMSLLGGGPDVNASLGQTDVNAGLAQPAPTGASGG